MDKIIKFKVGDIFLDKNSTIVIITGVRIDYYDTLEVQIGVSIASNEIRGYRAFDKLTTIYYHN